MFSELEIGRINQFFGGISPWEDAYRHASLSYFAHMHDGELMLLQARLYLRTTPLNVPESNFRSSTIRVGHYFLSDIQGSPRVIVDEILTGKLTTAYGAFRFLPDDGGRYSAGYMPFHHEGIRSGSRVAVLTLTGARNGHQVSQPECDWELKAAPRPYDNLNELLFEHGLSAFNASNAAVVEIIASPACEVDFNARVDGATATPGILVADRLSRNKCRLGYRVFHQGKVVERATIDGSQMRWESRQYLLHGSLDIQIPKGAVIHCSAIYDSHAQHQGWIADPSTVQNPYRAVYEAFDGRLAILSDFLEAGQSKGRDARDLEIAIAWLLWMLGFSVAHLGGTAKTQDAPDLVATTPRGNFVVIECTTGLLKAENKLSRLVERTEMLRRRLDASGNRHLHVLPVIITSKEREEIRADVEQAERLGVLVLTKESLHQAINRTLVLPDAERLYAEGERTVREHQARYTRQLPLG